MELLFNIVNSSFTHLGKLIALIFVCSQHIHFIEQLVEAGSVLEGIDLQIFSVFVLSQQKVDCFVLFNRELLDSLYHVWMT